MQKAGIEEARAALGDLIDQARLTGQPTQITRYGKPAAVIVPCDFYERALKALSKEGGA